MVISFETVQYRLVDPGAMRRATGTSISSYHSSISSQSSTVKKEVSQRDECRCILSGEEKRVDVCHLIPRAYGNLVSSSLFILIHFKHVESFDST